MCEILFRGKPTEKYKDFLLLRSEFCKNGFVYGNLVIDNGRYYICVSALCSSKSYVNNGITTMCEVIPETVGQFTGLTDKNGTKIFEGDILKQKTTENFKKYSDFEWEKYGVVCFGEYDWNEGESGYCSVGWFMRPIKSVAINPPNYHIGEIDAGINQTAICGNCYPFEVIGNIHDNPELLKGGE